MLSVCITRWSTVMYLLLVMSTLPPCLFPLPNVQSSVVPIGQPSTDSNFSLITTRDPLIISLPPADDAQQCHDSLQNNPKSRYAVNYCFSLQAVWLKLLNQSADPQEYNCKVTFCKTYCANLDARTFCLPEQYAVYHKELQQGLGDKVTQGCKKWAIWVPPLDPSEHSSPPLMMTNEVVQCDIAVREKCSKKVKIAKENITDPTERACKTEFELEECAIKLAPKYCANSTIEQYLNFIANFWSPKKVECNDKFTTEKPAASINSTTTESTTTESTTEFVELDCMEVLIEAGETALCFAEAITKYPNVSVENQCRAAYYVEDCGMRAACKFCSDTKDFVDGVRMDLDALSKGCKQWMSSDVPRLGCSIATKSRTERHATAQASKIMICIIIVVIGILVAIGVVICSNSKHTYNQDPMRTFNQ